MMTTFKAFERTTVMLMAPMDFRAQEQMEALGLIRHHPTVLKQVEHRLKESLKKTGISKIHNTKKCQTHQGLQTDLLELKDS